MNWIVFLDVDFCEYESNVESKRFNSIGDKLQCEACSNGVWESERESFSVGWRIGEDEVRGWKVEFAMSDLREWIGSDFVIAFLILMRVVSLYRCKFQLFQSIFSGSGD